MLQMFPLQRVLWAPGYRDLQQYFARIEHTDWFRVLFRHSTCHARPCAQQDWSSGRSSDLGDFIWVDPSTTEVVDGDSAERRRFQAFCPWSSSTGETHASDSQGRSDKQRRVHNSCSRGSYEPSVESVAYKIVIDDRDGLEGEAPHSTVVEEDQGIKRDFSPQEPMKTDEKLIEISGAFSIVTYLKAGWKIRACVQFHG